MLALTSRKKNENPQWRVLPVTTVTGYYGGELIEFPERATATKRPSRHVDPAGASPEPQGAQLAMIRGCLSPQR